ncbi:MAG: zinc-ribbon domain-containing protein [Planctomycetes bacterium]|nr:zinc-ribbon domain-containing protein [Planctomycetota bacterium]
MRHRRLNKQIEPAITAVKNGHDSAMPDIERYSNFVEHPRFGRGPRFTGLNPQTDFSGDTYIHWHSPKSSRIPKTAIAADLNKQVFSIVAVTHYYDVKRKCRDCGRMFIFFAAEQQHWYEDLQFGLDSDCVRCVPCRKQQQDIAKTRQRYEDLFHQPDRTADQCLTMAECCLDLIEHGEFTSKQTQRVRRLLNSLPDENAYDDRVARIRQRLHYIEHNTENAV